MADMPVCFSLFFFNFLSDNQIFVLAMSSSSQQLDKYLSIFCFYIIYDYEASFHYFQLSMAICSTM